MTPSANFHFELLTTDLGTSARRSRLMTPRGAIELPTFMPVGTLGTVKGITIDQVALTGAEILLGNTYHLALRPGEELRDQGRPSPGLFLGDHQRPPALHKGHELLA